jgi:hypothetical protein
MIDNKELLSITIRLCNRSTLYRCQQKRTTAMGEIIAWESPNRTDMQSSIGENSDLDKLQPLHNR